MSIGRYFLYLAGIGNLLILLWFNFSINKRLENLKTKISELNLITSIPKDSLANNNQNEAEKILKLIEIDSTINRSVNRIAGVSKNLDSIDNSKKLIPKRTDSSATLTKVDKKDKTTTKEIKKDSTNSILTKKNTDNKIKTLQKNTKRDSAQSNIEKKKVPRVSGYRAGQLYELFYSASSKAYRMTLLVEKSSPKIFGFELFNDWQDALKLSKREDAFVDDNILIDFPFGEKIRGGKSIVFYINAENLPMNQFEKTYKIKIPTTKKNGVKGNDIIILVNIFQIEK